MTDFNPCKYGGWPDAVRRVARENMNLTPLQREVLNTSANVLHRALEAVRDLHLQNTADDEPRTPDPVTGKRVRNALWEVWENRLVVVKRDRDQLQERVRQLQESATAEVEKRREVEKELKDVRKVLDGLERLVGDLFDNPPLSRDNSVPRCDVPDLGNVAAQFEGRTK